MKHIIASESDPVQSVEPDIIKPHLNSSKIVSCSACFKSWDYDKSWTTVIHNLYFIQYTQPAQFVRKQIAVFSKIYLIFYIIFDS